MLRSSLKELPSETPLNVFCLQRSRQSHPEILLSWAMMYWQKLWWKEGGIDVCCIADHKTLSLTGCHVVINKGSYYRIQLLLFSVSSRMESEQFTVPRGDSGST